MLELQNNQINAYQLQNLNHWSLDDINKFKSIYESKLQKNSEEAKECLNTIYEYGLTFKQSLDLDNSKLHKIGIENILSKVSKNRKIDELIKNHNKLIKENELTYNLNENDGEIIKRVNNIKNLYKTYLDKNITKETITDNIKKNDDELIAIAMSTLKLQKDIILRDCQIYALILLLNKKKDKGKIIKLFSGEGKTILTFCLSIILALKGYNIDILCFSPETAEKDSKEAEKILEKLKITVGNNIDRKIDSYKKDVLYGNISQFLGDIMNDEYLLKGIRQDRKFDVLIVDEIDTMFLDDHTKSTGLVTSKPFLEINSFYLLILWGYYKNLYLNKYEINKNIDLRIYLRKYLDEKLKNYIKIDNDKSDYFFPINSLIKDYAIEHSQEWTSKLISSLSQKKNVDYTIKEEAIVPVDLGETGVIQNDKIFSGGLQQFLQMQNNLSVTSISTNTTTNSLSHYGFFQKYRNNERNFIYGTASAIGSKESRKLIEDIYGVEFDYIPTNNNNLLKELTSTLCINHDSWIENILRIIKREINSGRGVLILCETVEYCEEIYDKTKKRFSNFKLIKIIGEENEKDLINTQIEKNTVIISTDISGKGIDFKMSESILKNGGLHIIFSFIPSNSRIEEKNYKIIGEAGNPGTIQFVIDFEEIMNNYYFLEKNNYKEYITLLQNENKNEEIIKKLDKYSIKEIKNLRDKRVSRRCENVLERINNINKEDFLFNIYCNIIKERKELKESENEKYLNSIDERWGIFQSKLDISDKSLEQMKLECENFKKMIISDLDNGEVIKNPGFYNQLVNEKLYLFWNNTKEKNIIDELNNNNFQSAKEIFVKYKKEEIELDKYIQACDSSIKLDNYSFIPYYLKGICKILNGKNGIEELNNSIFYIREEIKRFFNLFGLLISLDINIDLLFHHINILNSIKTELIEKNINYYNKMQKMSHNFRIYSKYARYCFYLKEEDDEKKEKEQNIFMKNLRDYYSNLGNNGLKYFYSLEKISTWKLNSMIVIGIIMIGLSVVGLPYLKILLTEEVFLIIQKILGINLSYDEYKDWINANHEKENPFYPDNNFSEFVEKNNIKIKNIENDLEEILKKYDKEYENKIKKEKEKLFKKIFWIKILKLDLEKITDLFDKNDETGINKNNETITNKYKSIILKDMSENKRKIILANNLLRRDGRDWLTNENDTKDFNEKIKEVFEQLNGVADTIIRKEIKNFLETEIDNFKNLRNKKTDEVNNQIDIINNKKEEYNKHIDLYNKSNKENNSNLNNLIDKVNQLQKEYNKEKDIYNKLAEEYNKCNEETNKRIRIFNRLNDDLIIDFSSDELKINMKNKDPLIEEVINKIEKEANLAYKDELLKIEKYEEEKENTIYILKKRIEFQEKLLKIIKDKNYYWNNCFNKAKLYSKYIYNSDDMKRINKYEFNKNNKKEDYYYISDINKDKYIKKAKEKLEKNKIIIGNYCNENNIWDNYCLLIYNNSIYFLYKSADGNNPSDKLIDLIKKIAGNNYVTKINKISYIKDKELSEVDAIENNKIILNEIKNNSKGFLDNFEKYSNFFNKSKDIKENIKQNIYPEEFIISIYNEIKKRNNTLRISLIFFKIYFLNKEKDNEIDIDFLKKIFNILLNYNEINEEEKNILKKEYSEIISLYKNKYQEIKKQEEEEEKEAIEIIKNKKKKHNIKNIKKNNENEEDKKINPDEKKENSKIITNDNKDKNDPKENLILENNNKVNKINKNKLNEDQKIKTGNLNNSIENKENISNNNINEQNIKNKSEIIKDNNENNNNNKNKSKKKEYILVNENGNNIINNSNVDDDKKAQNISNKKENNENSKNKDNKNNSSYRGHDTGNNLDSKRLLLINGMDTNEDENNDDKINNDYIYNRILQGCEIKDENEIEKKNLMKIKINKLDVVKNFAIYLNKIISLKI